MKKPFYVSSFWPAAIVLAIIVVVFFFSIPRPEMVSSEQRAFTVMDIERAQRFVYADLKDGSGQVFHRVYVSVHCDWRKVQIGSAITLTVNHYDRAGEKSERIDAGAVCPPEK